MTNKPSRDVPVVPFSQWAKDHWSTLAYVETRIVDHGGLLDLQHMRCNPRVHRRFTNLANVDCSGSHPTRLADGTTLDRHDDWSCIEDAIALDLLTMDDEDAGRRAEDLARDEGVEGPFTRARSPRFKLTTHGLEITARLRAHKAAGGHFSTFRMEDVALSPTAPPPTTPLACTEEIR